MGFFRKFMKVLSEPPKAGTPNVSPTDQSVQQHASGSVEEQILTGTPAIVLKNLQSHRRGDQLSVTVWVQNTSSQRIQIDNSNLLKPKPHFQQIGPQQSHQLTLYQGPAPHAEAQHRAEIVYRSLTSGKVFRGSYRINYHLDSDGTREINQLMNDRPVQVL